MECREPRELPAWHQQPGDEGQMDAHFERAELMRLVGVGARCLGRRFLSG